MQKPSPQPSAEGGLPPGEPSQNDLACLSRSVMCDPLRPHGLWPTRPHCPGNSPGKNTGVVCHFLLQGLGYLPAEDLGRHFSEEDIQMAYRPHEKTLNITNKRKCKAKTTKGYCVTPVRMAIIKNSAGNKCWRRGGEKRNLLHC